MGTELPTNVDWRDMNGTNFLSWNKNQHIPVYCGSCWAQGTTSALADRFNIMLGDENPTPVALDAQVIVNCEAGDKCKDCTWPPCPANETCQDKCWAVEYKHYYAKNYYSLRGAAKMKADLAKYGPIACGIEVT